MTTKVQKWGNSLALRLPKDLVKSAGLSEGKEIELSQTAGGILMVSKNKKPQFQLEKLLAKITPENRHAIVSWDDEQGVEKVVWEE